jgi:hypothetical protein
MYDHSAIPRSSCCSNPLADIVINLIWELEPLNYASSRFTSLSVLPFSFFHETQPLAVRANTIEAAPPET